MKIWSCTLAEPLGALFFNVYLDPGTEVIVPLFVCMFVCLLICWVRSVESVLSQEIQVVVYI